MAISSAQAKLARTKATPVLIVVNKGAEKVNYTGVITSVPHTINEELATVSGRKQGTKERMQSLGWVSLSSIFLLGEETEGDGDDTDQPSFTSPPKRWRRRNRGGEDPFPSFVR